MKSCKIVCVIFLLQKGADATVLDIDGNFAIDHATEGSYVHVLVQEYLKKSGRYTYLREDIFIPNNFV